MSDYVQNDPNKVQFGLFPNDSPNPSAPELKGGIKIHPEFARTLTELFKRGEWPVYLEVAVWGEQVGNSGKAWRSSNVQIGYKYLQEQRNGGGSGGGRAQNDQFNDPLPGQTKKEAPDLTEPDDDLDF